MTTKKKPIEDFLLQSLEHELGGVKVYTTALTCAQNEELKGEWEDYLAETREHVAALETVCQELGVDPTEETPGRKVVRHIGGALVEAMTMAREAGDPAAAELVACECIVLAETKDHLDWSLLSRLAAELGAKAPSLLPYTEEIEDQEDEHLYHSKGWCRELWIASLGLPAVIPPLEEQRQVKTALGAARAEQATERVRLARKHGVGSKLRVVGKT
jgi:rubrerythrin